MPLAGAGRCLEFRACDEVDSTNKLTRWRRYTQASSSFSGEFVSTSRHGAPGDTYVAGTPVMAAPTCWRPRARWSLRRRQLQSFGHGRSAGAVHREKRHGPRSAGVASGIQSDGAAGHHRRLHRGGRTVRPGARHGCAALAELQGGSRNGLEIEDDQVGGLDRPTGRRSQTVAGPSLTTRSASGPWRLDERGDGAFELADTVAQLAGVPADLVHAGLDALEAEPRLGVAAVLVDAELDRRREGPAGGTQRAGVFERPPARGSPSPGPGCPRSPR